MNKHQLFLVKLIEKYLDENFKKTDLLIDTILKEINKSNKTIERVVADVMLKYELDQNNCIKLTKPQIKQLNIQLEKIIIDKYKKDAEIEKKLLLEAMKRVAEETYYYNAYAISIGMNFKLKILSEKELIKIVNTKINKELWSDRIWKNNKNQVQKRVRDVAINFLKGDLDANKVHTQLMLEFNRDRYEVKRLVNTEMARVQAQAQEQFGEDHGAEYQLFSATLDTITSQKCREKDGKQYEISDKNKPVPPLHPNCRSCLINLPWKDYRPKTRMDNIKKEIIPYQTFEEWQKENKVELKHKDKKRKD